MRFNLIFTAILALNLASGGTVLTLANRTTLTEPQARFFDIAMEVCSITSTTLIGLLSTRPNNDNEADE